MLEELLALGHSRAEYDAWLIRIGDGDQFGSRFVGINPQLKIPALQDRTDQPTRCGCLSPGHPDVPGRKFGAFAPGWRGAGRVPVVAVLADGQCAVCGRRVWAFYAYAPVKIEYAIDRYAMETKRQLDVLNQRLAVTEYVAGNEIHRGRHGDLALVWADGEGRGLRRGRVLQVHEYTHVLRWAEQVGQRRAVQRGRMVNRVRGDLANQLHERHDASDFDTKTQDKLAAKQAA